jgi:hypothetical protein
MGGIIGVTIRFSNGKEWRGSTWTNVLAGDSKGKAQGWFALIAGLCNLLLAVLHWVKV